MPEIIGQQYPCPLCGRALVVRESKKDKPYVVCNPCGVQMFVRNAEGINRMEQQIASGSAGNALERLRAIEKRYRLKCPKCGREFWLDPAQVETSWFDGEFEGFKFNSTESLAIQLKLSGFQVRPRTRIEL